MLASVCENVADKKTPDKKTLTKNLQPKDLINLDLDAVCLNFVPLLDVLNVVHLKNLISELVELMLQCPDLEAADLCTLPQHVARHEPVISQNHVCTTSDNLLGMFSLRRAQRCMMGHSPFESCRATPFALQACNDCKIIR